MKEANEKRGDTMRNKKNTLYIILALIVVIVGIVILSKDGSKTNDKKKDEATKSEQTSTTTRKKTKVKKVTEQKTTQQPTATTQENTTTAAETSTQQKQVPSSTQQAVTTTARQKPQAFYGIWCDAYKKRATAEKQAVEYSKYGIDAQVFETTQWSNLNSERWYVISAGVYETKESANEKLSAVKEKYPDAYVKYSGDWLGE